MEDIHVLPLFRIGFGEIKDGLLVKIPDYCKKNYNKKHSKCEEFYKSIYNIKGPHECPYGFTTYVVEENGHTEVFTCFRLKDYYNKDKTKDRVAEISFNPVFNKQQFDHIIEMYRKNERNKEKHIESTRFVKDTLHEIRNLNTQIVHKSEDLVSHIESMSKKKYDTKCAELSLNIFALSSLIASRYSTYDALMNPEALKIGDSYQLSIYNKFYKLKQCYQNEASKKGIEIKLVGESKHKISGYQLFDLLPFLLFENAIKYSPRDRNITVTFTEKNQSTSIIVESIGPYVEENELPKVLKKGFRSRNAQRLSESGSGIGLFLAQKICDVHNINIKVDSKITDIKYKGIEHGIFMVYLDFNDVCY